MLAWLSVALAAVALALSVRWVFTRVDVLGRVQPFPAISVGAAAVAALACAIPVLLHARLEHRLGAAASAVAGRRVEVHCQTLSQTWLSAHAELGYVEVGPDGRPEPRTVIALQACDDLSDWLGSDRRSPTADQVIAVHVITHEAMHMAGELAEARAECLAVQRDAQLVRALGASREQALALARQYWLQVYPQMPDEYRSGECAPGGSARRAPAWRALGHESHPARSSRARIAPTSGLIDPNGAMNRGCRQSSRHASFADRGNASR